MGAIVLYHSPRCSFQTQLPAGGYQATYRPMVCGGCAQLVNVLEDLSPKMKRLAGAEMLARLGRRPACQSTDLTPGDDKRAPGPRCASPVAFTSGPSWGDSIRL